MTKKFLLKTALICILLLSALIFSAGALRGGISARADSEDEPAYAYGNSSMVIDVDENKLLHIKENLTVGFVRSVSGMTRRIPAKTTSYKAKGGKVVKSGSFLSRIDNVKASFKRKDADEYETAETSFSKNGTDYYLSVHNPNGRFAVWEKGHDERQYNITVEYDFDLSDDGAGKNALALRFFDEVKPSWFNYNGDKSNVAKLYVTVNMPKAFQGDNAKVFFGSDDITENSGLTVDGNKNSLNFSVPFKDINGNTVRIALDDNYFDTSVTYYSFYWYFVGLVAIIILICIILTVLYRGRKPVITVETAPPVINPLHYSAYWHGIPKRKDVTTIILYWAQLGCVKIAKDGKKNLILTKLKDLPDERSGAEKRYFNELFSDDDIFHTYEAKGWQNRVRRDKIRYNVNALVEESEKPTPFVPQVEHTKLYIDFFSVISLAVVFTYFILLCRDWIWLAVLIPFLAFTLYPLAKMQPMFSEMQKLKQKNRQRFHGILVVALCGLIPAGLLTYFLFTTQYMPQYDYIHITIISILWVFISFFVLPVFIKKRTEEANALYGRMLGFKRFITLAQIPEMELILKENPDYYYDILPYCMVMGLSKKLDKQMRHLNVAVPDWADGFNPAYFAEELFYSVKHAIIVRKKRDKNRNQFALDD